MKPGKLIERIKKDTQPSITSFFKKENKKNKNLIIGHKHLNNTEINVNQTNTNNKQSNYDKKQTTIVSNKIITKKISKTASLIGKLKKNIFIHKEVEG